MRTPADAEGFDALLAAYLDELRRHHYAVSSQVQARSVLPRFFSHLREEGIRDLRSVNEAHFSSFVRALQKRKNREGKPLSHATQVDYLYAVRRFMTFLEKRGFILRNPARAVSLPRVQALPRYVLTEAEARRLMAAPSSSAPLGLRDRTILEVLYGTALRLSECVRLDMADLDLRERTLLVRNGKGRKDRVVPIPGRAALALDGYLQDGRPDLVHDPSERALFLSRNGRRLSGTFVQLLVRGHARAAGITKRVSPHVLRHTCATHLLQGGASLRHIQKLLGHQGIETTAIYSRVAIDDLRRVVAKAHPREGPSGRRR